MKKVVISLLLGVLLIGLVSVMAQGNGQGKEQELQSSSEVESSNQQKNQGEEVNLQNQIQKKVKSGNYIGESGQQIQVQEKSNNKIQLRVGNFSVNCDCELTQEQVQNKTRLKTKLSNGRNAEIKIMPDRASERALERLKLKNCAEEQGCSIELKEVGQGEQTKLVYELKTQRQAKFLGLFRARMQVQAQVDAETGEIVRVKKPWWAFLASEPEEE
ncbi:MAG: hypothetical protein ABIG37_01385 [Nanoarchaeota archaeon]